MEPLQTSPVTQVPPAKPKGSLWGTLAIVLVLALIVIGALYAWGERIAIQGGATPEERALLEELRSQNNSTDPSSIEADLEAQTADDFGADVDAAFEGLDAAFEGE